LYLPATQLLQSVVASKPENLPAAQLVQTEAPVFPSYFPVGQSVQTVSPVVPAYLPVGQTVHSLTPVSRLLYLPTGHAEQEREAESEYFPFSHAVQSAAFSPPAAALTFPAGQAIQVELKL
jgi:hypothetical protein